MRTLRGRLILSHILPILIVGPLISLGIIYLIESQLILGNLSENLDEQATLIAEVVESQASHESRVAPRELLQTRRPLPGGEIIVGGRVAGGRGP